MDGPVFVSLSTTTDTMVTFGAAGIAQLETLLPDIDPAMFAEMQVRFAPDAALDDTGTPATEAVVIPVASEI